MGESKIHYGFTELPYNFSLWLDCVSGDAVAQIIAADLHEEIISERRGAYGGIKRTILVDVSKMDAEMRKYWDRMNRKYQTHIEATEGHCHYCGGEPVTGRDFFESPVCEQCSN
jgi:hypothetical protein